MNMVTLTRRRFIQGHFCSFWFGEPETGVAPLTLKNVASSMHLQELLLQKVKCMPGLACIMPSMRNDRFTLNCFHAKTNIAAMKTGPHCSCLNVGARRENGQKLLHVMLIRIWNLSKKCQDFPYTSVIVWVPTTS